MWIHDLCVLALKYKDFNTLSFIEMSRFRNVFEFLFGMEFNEFLFTEKDGENLFWCCDTVKYKNLEKFFKKREEEISEEKDWLDNFRNCPIW
jgi:hypothetical protein